MSNLAPSGNSIITDALPNLNDEKSADFIFYNGNVITVDNKFSQSEAIAIKGEKIIAIGNSNEIIDLYALKDQTQIIDLANKSILPVFIDGHSHLFDLSRFNEYGISGSQTLALSYGWTSITEKYGKDDIIEMLLDEESEGNLKMRINIFASYNEASLDENNKTIILESWYPANSPVVDANNMLRIPGLKIFMDGSFQPGRGAWAMTEEFPEEDMNTWLRDITSEKYGDLYLNQDELEPIVQAAQDSGFQVAFHAMGDRAIETVVNTIGNVTSGSNTDNRHQIEHSSYLRTDLLYKYVEIDMISSVRGYFPICSQSADVVENFFSYGYFNKDWYINRYNMTANGIHTYLETDFAWNHEIGDRTHSRNIDPFLNLFGLVTRAQVAENGSVCHPEPWMNPDKISIEQALRIMTIEGAYAVSLENFVGSLEVGKFADLIILPSSPLTMDPYDLKDLYTILTMVAGNVEYQKSNSILTFETYLHEGESTTNGMSYNLEVGILWIVLIISVSSKYKKSLRI